MLIRICFIILLLSSCSKKSSDTTWDVVSNGGVTKITPAMALSNIGAYVLKQTHRTIFSYDKNGNLDSKILKTWSTSRDYKQIKFCIDESISFNETRHFDTKSLKETVNGAIKDDQEYTITEKDNCLNYTFKTSAKYLLYKLTLLFHAPSIKSDIENVEIGLGDFKVLVHSPQQVHLVRKNEKKNAYNTIKFYDISSFDKTKLNDSIEDYNRISPSQIPQGIKENYNMFNVSILKSAIVIFNIEDDKSRSKIFNCISTSKLRNILFENQENKVSLKYITPIGIPGSEQGSPKQNCDSSKLDKTFIFANWKHDKKEQLQQYFDELSKQIGIKVQVKNFSFQELNEMVWKTKTGYDLVVPFLDSTQNAVAETFSAFANQEQKFFNFDTSYLMDNYNELMNIGNKSDIAKLVKKLNVQVEENHLAIPLKQVTRPFFFPKRLKRFSIGSDLLEHPDVGSIEL
ncbi:hypothetical protein [Halobacteriovorax sp. HLS]|uniref:hypothetical protein n=1 Tax=Halobacteriovorax sp. HLS TaxID=2234000 RepID=UPI000FD91ABC|nr:hypothetical protein [Halobacteriovorax sp. HLS]